MKKFTIPTPSYRITSTIYPVKKGAEPITTEVIVSEEEAKNMGFFLKEPQKEEDKLKTCPDCGADPGKIHLEECDVQRCSSCGGQRLGCECEDHDPQFARWSGFWPGDIESKSLGIDLNQFYDQDYNKIFFIKPK